MSLGKFAVTDINGLTPAIDPTVSEKIFALNGRNYVFDSRGPRSAFGNRFLLPQQRSKPQAIQGIRLKQRTGDRCFTLDGDGIWEWREDLGGYQSIYATPDTTLNPYRWTSGYLSGYFFACHPRVGILALDLNSGVCQPLSQIGVAVPEDVLAIVVDNGRLIVIGTAFFSWSAPSNGLDFTPTLGGGGFQLISDRVPGSPIMVTSYTKGCLTWTTGGVLRSEFTGDAAVYRHRALNTEYRPVNSFCTCKVDNDTVVILDERGLFQSKGDSPVAYAPLFNEFLIEYIQQNNLRVGENLRLEWDELQRLLFVSASLSYADPIFESCFVLYPALDKWGQFSERHYGIFPLLISEGERADDYYGFADDSGRVRYWQNTGSREQEIHLSLSLRNGNLHQPVLQHPPHQNDGETGVVLSSTSKLSGIPKSPILRPAGYYLAGVTTPMTPELVGLNAKLQFGLMRPTGQTAADETSEISGVIVRSVLSGDQNKLTLDFNTVAPGTVDEDYNLGVGGEDYGIENSNYVNHKLTLIGTLDGITAFNTVVPDLEGFVKGARYYSCSCVGVWHIAEIAALDVGESFHLKTFEFTASSAGRLL